MKAEVLKGIILVGLCILTLLCGLLPVKLAKSLKPRTNHLSQSISKKRKYKFLFSCLSCFSAGVFLATCLLDLFPDVQEKLSDVLIIMNIHTSFPVPEFVMCFGLFVILIIEQIVLSSKEKNFSHKSVKRPLLADRQEKCIDSDAISFKSDLTISGIDDDILRVNQGISAAGSTIGSLNDSDSEKESLVNTMEESGSSHQHGWNPNKHSQSVLRSLLLLLALSLHSVFEGLAVGLERKTSSVLTITIALVLHKCVLSMSLGANLIRSKLSYGNIIKSVLFFSLTSPIGIGIGLVIVNLWDSTYSSLTQGLLQGIACGTFLYVTFFEIFPSEFNKKGDRLCKLLFVLLGFSTVSIILFFHNEAPSPIHPCSRNGHN